MLPISTSIHLTYDREYRIPISEQIRHLVADGFTCLDFNFLDLCDDVRSPFISEDWQKWIASAGEAAITAGAVFNQAHAPMPVLSHANDYSLFMERIRRSFIGCHMLGIPWMVFHYFHTDNAFGSGKSAEECNMDFFRSVLDMAHQYNVGIAIENLFYGAEFHGERLNAPELQLALIDELNDPLVGACWDTGHGNLRCYTVPERNGPRCDASILCDQYANLKRLGKRLKALHVHDNNGQNDDHIPPFQGIIDWDAVTRALHDIGYEHSFTFEAHNTVYRLRAFGVAESVTDDAIRLLHRIGEELVARTGL